MEKKMKQRKWLSVLAALVLTIGFSFSLSNNRVDAAYGRGSKVTVPKAYRGTWYSYDDSVTPKKVRFTAHTMNGKALYRQSNKSKGDIFEKVVSNKTSKKVKKQIYRVTGKWNSAAFVKSHGKKYLEVDPWITFETWRLYRPTTVKVKGKRVKILAYTNRYDGGNLYKSKKLARQMKNHKFKGIRYY